MRSTRSPRTSARSVEMTLRRARDSKFCSFTPACTPSGFIVRLMRSGSATSNSPRACSPTETASSPASRFTRPRESVAASSSTTGWASSSARPATVGDDCLTSTKGSSSGGRRSSEPCATPKSGATSSSDPTRASWGRFTSATARGSAPGSVVVRDVPAEATVVGVPARLIVPKHARFDAALDHTRACRTRSSI